MHAIVMLWFKNEFSLMTADSTFYQFLSELAPQSSTTQQYTSCTSNHVG